MEESCSLSPHRIFVSKPSAFGGMLTWNRVTTSSRLGSCPQASKSLMPTEVRTLQKDHICIHFASGSPCNSAWGTGREEERGKVLLHLGYHSFCCRCKETLAACGLPDVEVGI